MEIQLYHINNKKFKLKNHPFDIIVKNFTQTIIDHTEHWRLKITMFPDQRIIIYATNNIKELVVSYHNMYDAARFVYYLNLHSKI